VDFADRAVALVDARYFTGEHEADRRGVVLDFVEAGFGGFEAGGEFFEPRGMREVAGADNTHAFAFGPMGEAVEVALAAGGAGVFGMDVEVGEVTHGGNRSTARGGWQKFCRCKIKPLRGCPAFVILTMFFTINGSHKTTTNPISQRKVYEHERSNHPHCRCR